MTALRNRCKKLSPGRLVASHQWIKIDYTREVWRCALELYIIENNYNEKAFAEDFSERGAVSWRTNNDDNRLWNGLKGSGLSQT